MEGSDLALRNALFKWRPVKNSKSFWIFWETVWSCSVGKASEQAWTSKVWVHWNSGREANTFLLAGTTGKYGLYTRWNNAEIMYHVSTMLPYNPNDKQQVGTAWYFRLFSPFCSQQLERKRHIGNDIVVVVWQDGETVYRPTTISSRQVRILFS